MKHLTILVPEGQTGPNTLSCILGSFHVIRTANEYWKNTGKTAVFKTELAGLSPQSAYLDGMVQVRPQTLLKNIRHTDLIIIPAISPEFAQPNPANTKIIEWVRQQYIKGAELASMCTGAYLLASTGLVANKDCSIHWNVAANFSRLFPNVNLKPEKLITDEQGIYTNGGGYSFLQLLLYLVEKYYDRATAIYCSKIFQIDISRKSQSDFMIFSGQKKHSDNIIKKAQQYIEENFQENISVGALAAQLALGRRSFDRRFIKATGNTPLEYLQRVKIEYAKKSLESTRKNITEVTYESGYADPKAFREVFRKLTGLSPLEYRKRYNKDQ